MGRDGLALHPVVAVHQAVAAGVDVGIVDLRRVADQDDLRALRDAGDDRLHLVRRQLLRLVQDEEPPRDRAAADEAERLDLDQAALEQALVGLHERRPARGRPWPFVDGARLMRGHRARRASCASSSRPSSRRTAAPSAASRG